MEKTIIYHNNRCSKSREGLCILEEVAQNVEIREYMKTPFSKEELTHLIAKLGIEPLALVRTGESVFKENFKGKEMSNDAWIEAMLLYPNLIERPIVVRGNKAIIGRPPVMIKEFLK